MSYADTSDFSLSFPNSGSGSNLLSESPPRTGPRDDDLSISEFDQTVTYDNRDRDPAAPSTPGAGDDDGEQVKLNARRLVVQARDDKLQSDLSILKKLNEHLSSFNSALDSTSSANERIAQQLDQTNLLLNKYVNMLARTEDIARLVFDENWEGGEADEAAIEEEYRAAEEKARLEEEERERERERREREVVERERLEREREKEKEREIEKAQKVASRGGVRGVRGTRASMRGVRGSAPQTGGSHFQCEAWTDARNSSSIFAGTNTIYDHIRFRWLTACFITGKRREAFIRLQFCSSKGPLLTALLCNTPSSKGVGDGKFGAEIARVTEH